MLYTEWDWDKALDIAKEESYKDGERRGEEKKQEELIRALNGVLPAEIIAEKFHVPLEYVNSLLASENKTSCFIKKKESFAK